ncbi:hypothetical protein KTG15_02685 [Methanobacterium sp. YSL]|nr:hypothetical protein [Methanobacterium sp. YSL]
MMSEPNPSNIQWNGKNEILKLILREYFRIYKESILKKRDSISQEIVDKLYEILGKIFDEKNNSELLNIFFGTTGIGDVYNKFNYYEFMKLAIENKDKSRFELIRFIVALVKTSLFSEIKINDKDLNHILTTTLFQINKVIIDNNDFEMFKEQINAYSMSLMIDSPVELQQRIINDLHHGINLLPFYKQEINDKILFLGYLVKYKLSRDFNYRKNVSAKIDELGCDVLSEMYKNTDKITLDDVKNLIQIFEGNRRNTGVKPRLYEYYITSMIYRTFFMVGAYIIRDNMKKLISGSDYIRELWTQQNHGMVLLNKKPTEFDEFWLINLYLFGGINHEAWDDVLDYRLENFHEMNNYLAQYFIMTFIKAYDPSKNIFRSTSRVYENEELYDLLSRILSRRDDLIKQIDALSKESEDWSNLLKKEIEYKLKITAINDKKTFELAKILINKFFDKLKDHKTNLELKIPLDQGKVSKVKDEILNTYLTHSRLFEFFEFKHDPNLTDYIKIGYRPIIQKDCFIKTSLIDCDLIWNDISRIIIRGEESYFLDILLKFKDQINVTELKQYSSVDIFETIKKISQNLLSNDFKPDFILIPLEIFSKFRSENINPESPLFKTVIQNKFLKIDDVELQVVTSNKLLDFTEIIIMDTNSILWTYKPDETINERLWMNIVEFEEDKSKADICVTTKMKIEIIDPKGIEKVIIN